MQDGRIHTRDGTFKTPTGWVSKVTGVKVKKQAAYDKVRLLEQCQSERHVLLLKGM